MDKKPGILVAMAAAVIAYVLLISSILSGCAPGEPQSISDQPPEEEPFQPSWENGKKVELYPPDGVVNYTRIVEVDGHEYIYVMDWLEEDVEIIHHEGCDSHEHQEQ